MRRYRVVPGSIPHYCTCTIVGWMPIFSGLRYFEVVAQSFQFGREHKNILLNAYVIMPTHLHVIMLPKEDGDLSGFMRDFKRHTSQQISSLLEQDGRYKWLEFFGRAAQNDGRPTGNLKIWQEEFPPEAIETERFYLQKLNYLHENPVRKGFVERPDHWLYSSARTYESGQRGPVEIDLLAW